MILYALVVVHNCRAGDSASLVSLRSQGRERVLVADNSEGDFGNAAACGEAGWLYLPLHGNRGLAVAYNRGIDYLREHTDCTHVLLLDDDTTLPESFWEGTERDIERAAGDGVFLPQVRDEKGILSPCRICGFRVTRVRRPEELPQEELTGINSGMVVPLSVFRQIRYDEGYFLDYIDHAFLREIKARRIPIFLTGQRLTQRFADNDRADRAARRRRARLFAADFRRFCGDSPRGRLVAALVTAYRRWRAVL